MNLGIYHRREQALKFHYLKFLQPEWFSVKIFGTHHAQQKCNNFNKKKQKLQKTK